ncbi:50S ribosomal protein L20 [Candidatus Shikimatogenerans bostrichidophilus]|uniref:50S ribosomal protein L20 n=1 Tax=Candidatus Shikimatogenerans bostrichidophilus TaxID=2943807 RepID=UPI0029672C25
MPRSKNIVASKKRRKKYLKYARGFYGAKKRCYTIAKNKVEKSWLNSYIGRKNKKKFYRKLWIQRINAYVRKFNISYSKFIFKLKKKKIDLNRKIIAYYFSENKNKDLINQLLN